MVLLAGLPSDSVTGTLAKPFVQYRPVLPRDDDATHSGLGPTISINNQENPPQICSLANLSYATPPLGLSHQMTIVCVKLKNLTRAEGSGMMDQRTLPYILYNIWLEYFLPSSSFKDWEE